MKTKVQISPRPSHDFKTRSIWVVLLVIPLFCSCKQEDTYVIECREGVVDYEQLGNFRLKNVDPKTLQSSVVIQSEAEYFHFIDNSYPLPRIDFSTKTLLGGQSYSNLANVVSQHLSSDCARNEIVYEVLMAKSPAAIMANNHYFAIIPKISSDTHIQFLITYRD